MTSESTAETVETASRFVLDGCGNSLLFLLATDQAQSSPVIRISAAVAMLVLESVSFGGKDSPIERVELVATAGSTRSK
jgi:hypothetical protein